MSPHWLWIPLLAACTPSHDWDLAPRPIDHQPPPGSQTLLLQAPTAVIRGAPITLTVRSSVPGDGTLEVGDLVEFGWGTDQGAGRCPRRQLVGGQLCLDIVRPPSGARRVGSAITAAGSTEPEATLTVSTPPTHLDQVYLQAMSVKGAASATSDVAEVALVRDACLFSNGGCEQTCTPDIVYDPDPAPASICSCSAGETVLPDGSCETLPPPDPGCAPGDTTVLGSGETCRAILASDASAATGYYLVDPDGAGGVDPFLGYCDMDTAGGGWLLYASHGDGITATVETPIYVGSGCYGVLSDAQWVAARDAMVDGMLFLDENGVMSEIGRTKLSSGNCQTIGTVSTLHNGGVGYRPYLWHHEDSGCNATHTDYSLIRIDGSPYGAALYQHSAVKYDTWSYVSAEWSGDEQTELLYFIQ